MNRVVKTIGFDRSKYAGINGKDVYVAVLDSGVANHPDLYNKVVVFKDFTNTVKKNDNNVMYDDNGHGTHV